MDIHTAVEREPTVWVDPSLYVEAPAKARFRGTTPPPTVIGAYCTFRSKLG